MLTLSKARHFFNTVTKFGRTAPLILVLFDAGWVKAANAPPVILISIDTLRADHLGVYGYRRIATPNIDSFAEGGTIFRNIDSQTPLTLPSHTTIFTSTYPFENGVQENAEKVPGEAITLASVLKAQGYRTAAFIGSVFLERQMGLDKGFDTYDSPFNFEAFSPMSGEIFLGRTANPYMVRDKRDGALVIAAAERWMAANRNTPAFVFIHLFDLHTPYNVPEETARRQGISRYDAQLEYEDDLMGKLKAVLVRDGWWDRALTIVLSDHGEGLADHGEAKHGYFIYESTIHVPVIFHWPAEAKESAGTVKEIGGLIDVAPTILDFLRIPAPTSFEGSSLLKGKLGVVYSETMQTHDSFGWSPLRSFRGGGYKYIAAPRQELYDLEKDPGENDNIAAANAGKAKQMRSEIVMLLARYQKPSRAVGTTPDTEKLLTSLGYLGRGPRPRIEESGPDPKERLSEYRFYERATEAKSEGHLDRAVSILLQILSEDRKNLLARRDLGVCYLDKHNYEKARASLEELVETAPDDYPTQFGLGIADKHLGRMEEARKHLAAACRLAPQALQCQHELETLK